MLEESLRNYNLKIYFLCKLYVVSKKNFKYSDDAESGTVGISRWIVLSQAIAIAVAACGAIAGDISVL